MNEPLSEKIVEYINNRKKDKLEKLDKEISKAQTENDHEKLIELQSKREKMQQQFEVSNWLTDAAKRAKQISMVTHAAKYTHSDTRSSGVLFSSENFELGVSNYLSSASLDSSFVDVVGNAAALDVASLLQLASTGNTLLEEIATDYSPSLKALANDDGQYLEWLTGFKDALQDKQIQSGQLTKQVYFPLLEDGYHLLSPIFASSLSHHVHQKVTSAFFSEETKAARAARKKDKFYPQPLTSFPGLAIQSFGGTKPQNISQLNTQRYGKSYLLSSQPPSWETQPFLPKKGELAFWSEFSRRSWPIAKRLQKHLADTFQKPSTVEIRHKRGQLVDDLTDLLLGVAAEIQSKKDSAGWSRDSDLPAAEQLWLDPYRGNEDEDFAHKRAEGQWQEEIAQNFAHWLNRTIDKANKKRKDKTGATLKTGEDEFKEWQKLTEQKLHLLKEDLEAGI